MDDLIPIFLGGNSNQVKRAKWTFMVYLDADNNLEDFGIEDFLEMAEVVSNEEVNIIVQFDRIDGYDFRYDDWTACKRFHVTQGMTPTSEEALEDLGEINMGSSDTLTDFINWSVGHYPARYYALVLWNHGDGWRRMRKSLEMGLKNTGNESYRDQMENAFMERDKEPYPAYKGVCTDDTNGKDCLLNKEIQEALFSADTDYCNKLKKLVNNLRIAPLWTDIVSVTLLRIYKGKHRIATHIKVGEKTKQQRI